jgi:hypothetical protein
MAGNQFPDGQGMTKLYKTIVVDPPWQVKAGRYLGGYVVEGGKQIFDQTYQKSRDLPYSSMTI